jgi:hypothetical protein
LGYDKYGNQTAEAYFDVKGQPKRSKGGFTRWEAVYTGLNQLREVQTFGHDGREGYAARTKTFDDAGRVTEEAYFEADGKTPCRLENGGYSRLTHKYDEDGKLVERTTYGHDPSEGYAVTKSKYDRRGNPIEDAYFDTNGKTPRRHKDGYHRLRVEYDGRGNCTEEAYFGIDEKPCLCNAGYARVKRTYDKDNGLVESKYFDLKDNPMKVAVVLYVVSPNSQAQKLGLQVGDVLVTYDGKPVLSSDTFVAMRANEKRDKQKKRRDLVVERKGKSIAVSVEPGLLGVALRDHAVGHPLPKLP